MRHLLLHGLGVGPRYFEPLARELGGDVRLASLREPLPIAELAARAERELDRPAVVVANSMGCQVAVELAIRRPALVEALVLVGPTVDPRARSFVRQLLRVLACAWYEPPRLVAIVLAEYLSVDPRGLVRQARLALAHRLEERLPLVAAPALVLRGAHDPVCPAAWAREAAGLLPRGSLVTVAGGGHAVHFSHPAETAAAIRRLVAGTTPARA